MDLKVLSVAVEVVIVVKRSLYAIIYLFLPSKKKKKYVIKGELNCNTGNVNH